MDYKKLFFGFLLTIILFGNIFITAEEFGYGTTEEFPINYSSVNVNNSEYLQGLTPTQVASLYVETDPVWDSEKGDYLTILTANSNYVPYNNANSNINLTEKNITTTGVITAGNLIAHLSSEPAIGKPMLSLNGGDSGIVNLQTGFIMEKRGTLIFANQHIKPNSTIDVNGFYQVTSYDGQQTIPNYRGMFQSIEVVPSIPPFIYNNGTRQSSAVITADWNIGDGSDNNLYMFLGSNRQSNSNITNSYGLYLPDLSGIGENVSYGIYSGGGNNYFGGDTKIKGEVNISLSGENPDNYATGVGDHIPVVNLINPYPANSSYHQLAPYLNFIGNLWSGSASKQSELKIGMDSNYIDTPAFIVEGKREGGSWTQMLKIDYYGQFKSPINYNGVLGANLPDYSSSYYGIRLTGDGTATPTLSRISPALLFYSVAYGGGSKYMSNAWFNQPENGTINPIGVHKLVFGVNNAYPNQTNELIRFEYGDRLGTIINNNTLQNYNLKVFGDNLNQNMTFYKGNLSVSDYIQGKLVASDGTIGYSGTCVNATYLNGVVVGCND